VVTPAHDITARAATHLPLRRTLGHTHEIATVEVAFDGAVSPPQISGSACHISARYPRMVRSEENQPDRAVLSAAMRAHPSVSR
jgi:hypothetical protein